MNGAQIVNCIILRYIIIIYHTVVWFFDKVDSQAFKPLTGLVHIGYCDANVAKPPGILVAVMVAEVRVILGAPVAAEMEGGREGGGS